MPRRMRKASPDELERARKLLEAAGHTVKPPKPEYVHRGFQVEKNTLARFQETAKTLGLKIKDALHDALTAWIERHDKK